MYSLIVLEARRLKPGCWQGLFRLRRWVGSFLASLWLPVVAGNFDAPWLAIASLPSLPPSSHGLLPMCLFSSSYKDTSHGTSLVAQWLRIHLPMQGTRVQALVREDPTCHGATKPVRHNYWACALEPASQLLSLHATTTETHMPRARAPQQRGATAMRSPRTAMKSSPRSPQLEKACAQQRRPKNKLIN